MIGMDSGPIPTRAIREYALHYGLSGSRADRFHTIIRNLDNKTLILRAEKREKEAAKSKSTSSNGAGTIVDSW